MPGLTIRAWLMSAADPELASSKRHDRPQRPRDSATLIVVRRDGPVPRVLMGQRHGAHAFMPNLYVFPGGRYDAADGRARVSQDLSSTTLAKLMVKMRVVPTLSRARGLALTALRETFEETGYQIGAAAAPDLSGLAFIGRAITPPGRTRRFDSRFFAIDARHLGNLDAPAHPGSGELEVVQWLTFAEALALDLPQITRETLGRLRPKIEAGGWPQPEDPVPFQYQHNGKWHHEVL